MSRKDCGRLFAAVAIVLLAVVCITLIGCMAQPYDRVTGEKVGGPVSTLDIDDVPTTNPATGNEVVLVPTNQPDVDRLVIEGGQVIQKNSGAFGPYATIVGLAATAGVALYTMHRRKKGKARG